MACLWDELDFLEGGRLTSLSIMNQRPGSDELDVQMVILGQFVRLLPGQHVDVEEDFLGSHLPYRRAIVGGLDVDDQPWLFVFQAVPPAVIHQAWGSEADPFEVLRKAVANALVYNSGAQVELEIVWTRNDLLDVYADRVADAAIEQWSTSDLLRGLVAEICNVELADITAGYPSCAFPTRTHACQHDVFDDVFTAWAATRTA